MAWLTGWNYRKAVTITNAGSVLSDYQVLMTANTASLITAGKMRSDCGDIRFTDTDGSALRYYWIESGCNTTSTKLWVKIPSVPIGAKTIYLYYGNATPPSDGFGSNGTNTFDFFDDFSSSIDWTNKWQSSRQSSYSVSAGNLVMAALSITSNDLIQTKNAYTNFIYDARLKLQNPTGNYSTTSSFSGTSGVAGTQSCILTQIGGIVSFPDNWTLGASTPAGTWFIHRMIIPSSGTATGYIYSDNYASLIHTLSSSVPSHRTLYAGLSEWQSTSGTGYVDWVHIRKYASSEPISSISTTEELPANITSTNITLYHVTPCIEGTCIVTADVIWTNSGTGSGDFVPNIKIDNIVQTPIYPSQSLGPGASVMKSFSIIGLTIGTHTICPDPN